MLILSLLCLASCQRQSADEGRLPGLFSVGVNDDGTPRQVCFSQGNLQWSPTGGTDTPAGHRVSALFLPAAGYREGNVVYGLGSHVSCWTSSNSGVSLAWVLNTPSAFYAISPYFEGHPVRLCQDKEGKREI